MRQLFTISGRYAATEDVPITSQVGWLDEINNVVNY